MSTHTERLILRPSIASSGRTLRNSRTHSMPLGSLPSVETTDCRTSFHSNIWIAKFAKHTHSCVRMGFGPLL